MKKEITVCLMLPVTMTCVAEEKNGEVRILRILRSFDPTVADISDASTDDNLEEIDNAWAEAQ